MQYVTEWVFVTILVFILAFGIFLLVLVSLSIFASSNPESMVYSSNPFARALKILGFLLLAIIPIVGSVTGFWDYFNNPNWEPPSARYERPLSHSPAYQKLKEMQRESERQKNSE